MDTELLKTFLELEKTRHFGRAADNLYLTQAAVSSRIRQLEGLLGAPVFTRHRNNINLTAVGERLKPHAEAILSAWGRAVQESALRDQQAMQLALGGTPSIWDAVLQRLMHSIYRGHPELGLRAEAHSREVLTQSLLARSLDLALLFDPPKVEELEVNKLIDIELVLVSSQQQHFEQLFTQPYVYVDWGTSFNIQHSKLGLQQLQPVLHTNIGRIARDFMLDNGGSGFLPRTLANQSVEQGRLFVVEDVAPISRPVYSAYLRANDKRERIEQVLALMGEQAGSQ